MKTLVMWSKTENVAGKYFSSLFSNQHFGGYDLIVNIKQRRVTAPNGTVSVKTDVIVMLKNLDKHTEPGMLKTPFGILCLWCKTSDYIRDDFVGEGWNRQYVGCTCTRCGNGTLA